jgi:transcriptional regulator EpsA
MQSSSYTTCRPDPLEGRTAEALVRLIEAGIDVHSRHQFFVWARSVLHELIPHRVMVCGSYQRTQGTLVFEAVYGVPMAPALLALLTDRASPLVHCMLDSWLHQHGKSMQLPLSALLGSVSAGDHERLTEAGLRSALVHAVSRPQRPAEIENLFVLWSAEDSDDPRSQHHLNMVLPCLHDTYRRVLETERRLAPHRPPSTLGSFAEDLDTPMSQREQQILRGVQEGRSTQEIGQLLGISPYTVKNHVQNILRKLGAATRAQAVAKALSLGLLETPAPSNALASASVSSWARPYPLAREAPPLCPPGPPAAPHSRSVRSRGVAASRSPARVMSPPPALRRSPVPLLGRPPSSQ